MSDPLEYAALPPEHAAPAPESAPLPEEYPPPGSSAGPTGSRIKFDARAALLLVTALGTLTVTVGAGAKRAEAKPIPAPAPTQEAAAALPVQTPAPSPPAAAPAPSPTSTPRALSDAEILLRFGPWQNAAGTVNLSPDGDSWELFMTSPFDDDSFWSPSTAAAPDVSALADVLCAPSAELLCGTVWQAAWPEKNNYLSYLTAEFSPEGVCTITAVPYDDPDAEPLTYTFPCELPEGLAPQAAVTVEEFGFKSGGSTITTSGFTMPATLVFTPDGMGLHIMNIFSWGYTEFSPAAAD